MKTKITFLLFSLFKIGFVCAQINNLLAPVGSESFGKSVTVLSNGNYVVTDPLYDDGTTANVGAVYLYNGATHTLISTLKGSHANDQVGSNIAQPGVVALSNGNFLVCSNFWDNGTIADAGAVTWVNGTTGLNDVVSSTNSLVGSSTYDQIGVYGILKLTNGNYVVNSPSWDNGSLVDVGAVTWGNGTTGLAGTITSSNSILGSKANDLFGYYVTALTNGNYVICSPEWDNGTITDAGAITWCSGIVATTGIASTSNSLVGSNANDLVGSGLNNGFGGVTALTNGNYIVCSPNWDNGTAIDAGAVTWASGTIPLTGTITTSNSLVGNKSNDLVGSALGIALPNGNYVIVSKNWGNGTLANAGAVTWGNGTTGTFGVVSSSNSLVGSKADDQIGYVVGQANGITVLTNGNYVINSPFWDNGTVADCGAATWANGTTGIVGTISSSNSFVGVILGSYVGSAKTVALTNGNYVIVSPFYDNASTDIGAVVWGNGTTGTSGTPSTAGLAILTGGIGGDQAGSGGVVALSNGNYVVSSPNWDYVTLGTVMNAGAATWCNGATGRTGSVSISNSIIGSRASDFFSSGGIYALTNGNFVVLSPSWDNGTIANAGAITWGNGTTVSTGAINASYSLVGASTNDQIGSGNFLALDNGNYVVCSPNWSSNIGAVTWCSGTVLSTGYLSESNSLIGDKAGDLLGNYGVVKSSTNNFLVKSSSYSNGSSSAAGALTYANGSTGTFGHLSSCNSIIGIAANGGVGLTHQLASSYNNSNNYFIAGKPADNAVTIYNPIAETLASSYDSTTNNNVGAAAIIGSSCNVIGTINTIFSTTGAVKSKIWFESTQPSNYVKRHHQINATTNNATAFATITLYYTQAEFDAFNAVNTVKLPTSNSDPAKANLLIEQRIGTSNNNSGTPESYTGTTNTINPLDIYILWNATQNRWEVTFEATGLGGFFVKTQTNPLPTSLLNFNATLKNNDAKLNWTTTTEINTQNFEVEYSNNAREFIKVATITAAGNSNTNKHYSYIHVVNNNTVHYYRLKMNDKNGKYTYSNIVKLKSATKDLDAEVFPTIVKDFVNVNITSPKNQNATLQLIDFNGRIVKQQNLSIVDGTNVYKLETLTLARGVYILKIVADNELIVQNIIKQ